MFTHRQFNGRQSSDRTATAMVKAKNFGTHTTMELQTSQTSQHSAAGQPLNSGASSMKATSPSVLLALM